MVKAHDVRRQLRRIGADYHFWGVPELRELPKVLFDSEIIRHVINGRYSGGFATLCATDMRVLLIDKKPLFLTLEDIRYDMVSDVMFNHRLMNASLILGTVHNSISFIGFNKTRLRTMTNFIQEKVMEYRNHQSQVAQPVEQPVFQPEPFLATPADSMEGTIYQTVAPVAPAAAQQFMAPVNPYRMPTMIRKRVTRD
jgi:hypothetical protein